MSEPHVQITDLGEARDKALLSRYTAERREQIQRLANALSAKDGCRASFTYLKAAAGLIEAGFTQKAPADN